MFSFNKGKEAIEREYPELLTEIKETVASINADEHKNKESKEVTMEGKMLYSPVSMNKDFKDKFINKGWTPTKINCKYSEEYYVNGYKPNKGMIGKPWREMDFVKEKVGIEVQFGKYAFMVYNVCAKMTIFHKLGYIDIGVEMVPIHELQKQMSTGVSYFEQFVWDLEQRGVSDIDIPVLILGINIERDTKVQDFTKQIGL